MATAHRRESMIALIATHEAIRVARDVGYPPVDLHRLNCDKCRRELDWRQATAPSYGVICPSCACVTVVPCHLRSELPPPPEPLSIAYEYDEELRYSYRPAEPPAPEHEPAPMWLVVFLTICFLSVIVAAMVTFVKLH